MKLRLFSTIIVFAVMIVRSEAYDQASSGYNADRYTSSGDDEYNSNDGSGSEGEDVQQVIDAMKKLNKNKSDDDISKNIKTGARHVMHSIVKKLITHTGEKVSKKVSNLLAESPENDSQKSTLPSEKTMLDYTSQNDTVTYAQTGNDYTADESSDKDENTKSDALPLVGINGANTQKVKETGNKYQGGTSPQSETSNIQATQNKVDQDTKEPDGNSAGAPERTTLASNADNKPLTGVQSASNKGGISTDLGSGSRALIPQGLTPENITANIGWPMDNALQKGSKTGKQTKHQKKRFKMHRHTRVKKKSKNYNGESRVKYKNVDKHLIKRGNKRTHTTKRSDSHQAERSSYQAPISNQLESVLNAKATREASYSNDTPNPVQRKRSYPSESRKSRMETSENDYDYDYDDSYDENSGVENDYTHGKHRNPQKIVRTKKRKANKKLKVAASRKSSSRHRTSPKLSKEATLRSTQRNRTMVKQAARYEAPVRKFKFFGTSRNYVRTDNTTGVNQGIPILNIESIAPKPSADNTDGSGHDDPQIQPGVLDKLSWQAGLMDQSAQYGAVGQSAANDQNAPNPLVDNPENGIFPVLLLKPTPSQSDVVVPTSSGRPIVPIVPSEESGAPFGDQNFIENPIGNSTSFVPPDNDAVRNAQSSLETRSVNEELQSLESRMTVVETAVAEVIESIRSRSGEANRGQSSLYGGGPPVLNDDVTTAQQASLPEVRPSISLGTLPAEKVPSHHARVLKQIFIPLPPSNTEAEREIENGEPVNGLPFPLNFIVSKILAKMLRSRDHKQFLGNHPHSPLPDINIPAIEHDINRLEMELASVPSSMHHRTQHHVEVVTPDTTKGPLLNALVTADSEDDTPGCTSPCENGGICMGNGVCQCPAPFSGPTCGSVTLVKVVKPTRRVVIEDPNDAVLEKLRRRALHPYITQIPQQVSDHRDRRRLVHMLKKLLRRIVTENENNNFSKRSELNRDIASPYLVAREAEG